MNHKAIIHLLSGGLDSVTMLYDLKQQGHSIHCLMFDYKQRHVQELTFAKNHCHRLGVLYTTMELPPLGGLTDENWIVPNRNCIMLSLAVNMAVKTKGDTVTIGCNKDDEAMFPDCRMAFIQMFNTMLTTAEINVEVCAPYLDWPKWKIADLSKQLGVPAHEIWTCYRGGAKPCGECPACIKLKEAMGSPKDAPASSPGCCGGCKFHQHLNPYRGRCGINQLDTDIEDSCAKFEPNN